MLQERLCGLRAQVDVMLFGWRAAAWTREDHSSIRDRVAVGTGVSWDERRTTDGLSQVTGILCTVIPKIIFLFAQLQWEVQEAEVGQVNWIGLIIVPGSMCVLPKEYKWVISVLHPVNTVS